MSNQDYRGMSEACRFFYANAGYSYGAGETPEEGRLRCAAALAAAEAWAEENGYTFEWEIDQVIDSSDFSDEEPSWELWDCAMLCPHGGVVDALGGVDFGRDRDPWMDDYRRVVEAELASEAMPEED